MVSTDYDKVYLLTQPGMIGDRSKSNAKGEISEYLQSLFENVFSQIFFSDVGVIEGRPQWPLSSHIYTVRPFLAT
jgi:hypothetical protein